jgi:hypothetical protein
MPKMPLTRPVSVDTDSILAMVFTAFTRIVRSPTAYWRKKSIGIASSRSHTAAWMSCSTWAGDAHQNLTLGQFEQNLHRRGNQQHEADAASIR